MAKRPKPKRFRHPNVVNDNFPLFALRIVKQLATAGYETYFVGGCIRDLLAGITPKDFDIVTSARPEDVRRVIRKARIIGRRFKLVLVKDYQKNAEFEVATFRKSPLLSKRTVTTRTDENTFGTMQDDFRRRDFTVNALYYDVKSEQVIDFLQGAKDLEQGILRSIENPVLKFQEDPVRMIRAARYSGKLDLTPEIDIVDAIHTYQHVLHDITPARYQLEFEKTLLQGNAIANVQILRDLDLFDEFFSLPSRSDMELDATLEFADHHFAKTGRQLDQSVLYAALGWSTYKHVIQMLPEHPSYRSLAISALQPALHQLMQHHEITRIDLARVRGIWDDQSRLDERRARHVYGLVESDFLSLSLNFLELRREFGEVSYELVNWWYRAKRAKRKELQHMVHELQPNKPRRKKKRRRKRVSSRAPGRQLSEAG